MRYLFQVEISLSIHNSRLKSHKSPLLHTPLKFTPPSVRTRDHINQL